MPVQSTHIASFLETEHIGDRREIHDVDSLAKATSTDLAYCTKYDTAEQIRTSNAGVIIAPQSVIDHPTATILPAEDPGLAFVTAADEFFVPDPEPNIHPTAVIEDGSEIGDCCTIGAHVYVGGNVTIGDYCVIHPGTALGVDGLKFARDESGHMTKHIQLGEVVIGDDVEIGANCTIDRSIFDETVIGAGTKIDNVVHVGHDCRIGEDVTVPASCTFAGHVEIGDHVRLNPEAFVGVYVTVGEYAEIGANSTVLDDVEPYTRVVGSPAKAVSPSRFAD